MMKAQRALQDIEMDLSHALRSNTSHMLEIGKLLNEAKTLAEHGEWLPWLRRHTALPARTAQQHMADAACSNAFLGASSSCRPSSKAIIPQQICRGAKNES